MSNYWLKEEFTMRMYDPPHPGPILAACFSEKRTIEDTATKMGVSVKTLTDIIEEKAPITPDIAVMLSTVITKIPASMWLQLQENYDSWQVEHNTELRNTIINRHRGNVASQADVSSMGLAFA